MIVVALVAGAAYGLYTLLHKSAALPFQNFSIQQITDSGNVTLAAISPDGKYIASAVQGAEEQSLWLRNVPTGSDKQIIDLRPTQYTDLVFSPDGNYIFYREAQTLSEAGGAFDLYRIPVLGGASQMIARDVDSGPVFLAAGEKIIYARANDPTRENTAFSNRTLMDRTSTCFTSATPQNFLLPWPFLQTARPSRFSLARKVLRMDLCAPSTGRRNRTRILAFEGKERFESRMVAGRQKPAH